MKRVLAGENSDVLVRFVVFEADCHKETVSADAHLTRERSQLTQASICRNAEDLLSFDILPDLATLDDL